MKRVGFIVTAWHNGRPSKTGAGYGLKVSATDQDRFFDKSWESVTLRLTAADSGRIVEVNVAKRSFRDGTCRELISKDIGQWFLCNKFAPWQKGHPPRFQLVPIRKREFEVKLLS